ncbi:MAG: endolytic transglycosylase MltG [Bacilli bacterium]|nr:endolytic transglycosylase MltG [Bacilli bacterium]
MRKYSNIAFCMVVISAVVIIISCVSFNILTGAVSNDSSLKEIEINSGSSYLTIASLLKENNLIKSETFYKIYIKLFKPGTLEACTYNLSENMGIKKIVNVLKQGCSSNPDVITITFNEGWHMRKIASVIASNTNNSEEDIFSILKDETFLDEMIDKYWFLTDEVKNDEIYYSLEGYLFPDTYEFINKDVSVRDIFITMLDEMENKLESLKLTIKNSDYTVHELLTLASIVESEAGNSDDRAGVAGVFYNRLENGYNLGSDVTTYYAIKVDVYSRDLTTAEINDVNAYNTRSDSMIGKLPVGPICNPGLESIEAVLNPTDHNYYYFVADKYGDTYFNTSYSGHLSTVASLKDQGLWYEYES